MNTLSKLTRGVSDFCYSAKPTAEEIKAKINKQIDRITQPIFTKMVLDWGEFKPYMKLQSPSEISHFYRGGTLISVTHLNLADHLVFWGTVENLPTKATKIVLKPSGQFLPPHLSFTVSFDAHTDMADEDDHISLFQLKTERDRPDPSAAVRMKKVRDSMARRGVVGGGTSFYGSGTVCTYNVGR